VVAIGLVIVATLVVIYLFNEPHRRDAAAEEKTEEAIHRGAQLFVQYCVPCHGPTGDGSAAGDGRIGVDLNTEQNQSDDPVVGPEREQIIRKTIERGRGQIMPAWGQADGGPLNEQQISELVILIREGGWDVTEKLAREASGGELPTPPPAPTPVPAGPEQGKQLFGQVCATCHKANDYPNGGEIGPDLTGLGAKQQTDVVGIPVTKEDLTAWINNPAAIKPGTPMPPKGGATTWGDQEVSSVVDYLLSLK
jgi:sulfur oxidation c-type cytochrome SoxX